MTTLIAKDTDKKIWCSDHPLQSWEWGEVRKKVGIHVVRFITKDEDKRRFFTVTIHPIGFGKTIAYLARSEWPTNTELKYMVSVLQSQNAIALKLEPDLYIEQSGEYHIPLLYKHWNSNGLEFVRSSASIFGKHTFLVDLTPSEVEMLKRMKQKTRYNIRVAQKHGVSIKDVSNSKEGFDIFFSLYQDTQHRQKYLGHGENYHRAVWDGMKEKYSKLFVAFYNDQPLAAYHMMYSDTRAFYVYGGTSSKQKQVMASNLLMWEVIRDAKKQGKRYFDMWGALPENFDPKDPWAGFHRFKEGYGGRHMTYMPTIDVVIEKPWYMLFSLAWPIRNKLLELKSTLKH
ncbi:MAG: peptidoglycan bridge formation glycyltransferase FemA/FemB family protein [Candidatus Roizmanbacteria bacterium]|nr:peptidoglycan bridge formation glycyltransferase FemA/FemB family protein [Candidatus Roizmanbacteria bacterium]